MSITSSNHAWQQEFSYGHHATPYESVLTERHSIERIRALADMILALLGSSFLAAGRNARTSAHSTICPPFLSTAGPRGRLSLTGRRAVRYAQHQDNAAFLGQRAKDLGSGPGENP